MEKLLEIEEILRLEGSKFGWIYFLVKEECVVYVGQTNSLRSRINRHKKEIDFDEYRYLEVIKDELDYFEQQYILKYRPKYNKNIGGTGRWYKGLSIDEYIQMLEKPSKTTITRIE